MTKFFPQQYTFPCIQHKPPLWVLLSRSVCSSESRPGGTSTHGEHPVAMIFMTFQKPRNWWSKLEIGLAFKQDLDHIWMVAHNTLSICKFSWGPECQISIWDPLWCLWIRLNPGLSTPFCKGSSAPGSTFLRELIDIFLLPPKNLS